MAKVIIVIGTAAYDLTDNQKQIMVNLLKNGWDNSEIAGDGTDEDKVQEIIACMDLAIDSPKLKPKITIFVTDESVVLTQHFEAIMGWIEEYWDLPTFAKSRRVMAEHNERVFETAKHIEKGLTYRELFASLTYYEDWEDKTDYEGTLQQFLNTVNAILNKSGYEPE